LVYARYGQGVYYVMAALAGTAALVMWSARKRLSAHQPQSEGSGG
jgi:PPP family 3-phenylpropionic acid transporter